MEKKVLVVLFIIYLALGCTSSNKEQSAKEIAYEALGEIIKPSDIDADSIYVIIPFGGVRIHEIFVYKAVTPVHLYSDFEIDTINGMKILFSTGNQLKTDTSYYKKSIDAGIVVLDKRIFVDSNQEKTFVIFQCINNNNRKIFDLDYYEDNKSKIIESLCTE